MAPPPPYSETLSEKQTRVIIGGERGVENRGNKTSWSNRTKPAIRRSVLLSSLLSLSPFRCWMPLSPCYTLRFFLTNMRKKMC